MRRPVKITQIEHRPAGDPVTFAKPDGSPLITIQVGPVTVISTTIREAQASDLRSEGSAAREACQAKRVHPYSSDYWCPCSLDAGHESPHSTVDGVTWTDDSPYALPAAARSGEGEQR